MSYRFRRALLVAVLGTLALIAGCTNKKSVNPLANVGSKQPDKVLFDKAMDAMKHNRFDVARLTLQTLINTYPDSEYIARAKLAVGDSWYAEGGTAALAQAEQEYSDFEIFFPNMPEAAEAQLKIANIHYQQMEKADRDFTHAKRAEDEYRKVILQYPDSKVVREAKQRLMEVQEVLADREYGIGRFYFLRESYVASIARLKSLLEKYPLYSRADEAAYMIGEDYEGEIARIRAAPTCDVHGMPPRCLKEEYKAKYIDEATKNAAEAYSKLILRYPMMDRADDARRRLTALHQPVPRPTKGAVERNKAEIASRGETTMVQSLLGVVKKGPDVSRAATLGEPTLVDPDPVTVTDLQRKETMAVMEAVTGKKATVEVVKPDQPSAVEGTSPAPEAAASNAGAADPPARMGEPTFGRTAAGNAPPAGDPNELKPTAASDPNELKPIDNGTDPSLPPPAQVNEIQQRQSSSSATSNDDSTPASDKDMSSSKKKKKGLRKIVPF
jgi:outer membrane protein assembly factor BamD